VHIVGVHILYLGWISSVHLAKCVANVHFLCFLFEVLVWAFMSKLPMKLQPPENFKHKDLFGDRISKGDVASSSHIHDDVIIPFPFVVEHQCEVMDLIFAQENIASIKKRKKAHEMNRHFQDTWVVKLPWTKFVLGSNGKVVQVWCKVYSLTDGKDKLLVTSLIHFGSVQVVVKLW
jgi:hypothetical protein